MNVAARPARSLTAGRANRAFWFALGSPALVEVSVEATPDAIVIDAQHGLWDRMAIEHAVGDAGSRTPVLIRTADQAHASISQALDAGAEGVLVPLIETARTGGGGGRCVALSATWRSLRRWRQAAQGRLCRLSCGANARTVVGVMIETERGVRNAAAIANTPGIDFVLIGTGDLAFRSAVSLRSTRGTRKPAGRYSRRAGTPAMPCAIFTSDARCRSETGEGRLCACRRRQRHRCGISRLHIHVAFSDQIPPHPEKPAGQSQGAQDMRATLDGIRRKHREWEYSRCRFNPDVAPLDAYHSVPSLNSRHPIRSAFMRSPTMMSVARVGTGTTFRAASTPVLTSMHRCTG